MSPRMDHVLNIRLKLEAGNEGEAIRGLRCGFVVADRRGDVFDKIHVQIRAPCVSRDFCESVGKAEGVFGPLINHALKIQTGVGVEIDQIAVRRGKGETREGIDAGAGVRALAKNLLVDQPIDPVVALILPRQAQALRIGQGQSVEIRSASRGTARNVSIRRA